eukprot:14363163-Ditylum_brightwellii.AAC.1
MKIPESSALHASRIFQSPGVVAVAVMDNVFSIIINAYIGSGPCDRVLRQNCLRDHRQNHEDDTFGELKGVVSLEIESELDSYFPHCPVCL